MKKITIISAVMLTLLGLYGCPFHYGYDYPNGKIPETPVNITSVNSEYDDINMTAPELFDNTLLVFSSNRRNAGASFDLVSHPLSFRWDKTSGTFSTVDENPREYAYLDDFIGHANTTGNEYGPLSFFQAFYANNDYYFKQYLFFSSDISGSCNVSCMKIKFSADSSYASQFDLADIEGPFEIPFLQNPDINEMYITLKMSPVEYDYQIFPTDNVVESIVYCDDTGGDFNLYSMNVPGSISLDSFLVANVGDTKIKLDILNSEYNDRCPFVCGDFMVFSSDRPGGLGGFDLYWTVFENGQWKAPVNFGEPINSSYNEYRAVVDYALEFENQLLIFSSDRPGGKGGYDLYYVGIDVMPRIIF